jgi:hypothetical protein
VEASRAVLEELKGTPMADVEVLDSPQRYYAEVMKPAYDDFLSYPATFELHLIWQARCSIFMSGFTNTAGQSWRLTSVRRRPAQQGSTRPI